MTRDAARSLTAGLIAVAIATVVAAPRDARAMFRGAGDSTSTEVYVKCLEQKVVPFCGAAALIYDPPAQEVTGLSLTIQYDPLIYDFDQVHSGPLGIFSAGGDAPPPNPGVGTQPLQLLPSTGFTPGAPLPGSTLTFTDLPGLLAVSYQLASPVTVSGDVNFFRIDFEFLNPIAIDLMQSTVTYETIGPGADFSTVSFACTTVDGSNACGSDTPSTGISLNLAVVPEPSTLVLLGLGTLALLVSRRR